MTRSPARRWAVFPPTLAIGFIVAARAVPHVRPIDAISLFVGGMAIAVALVGIVEIVRGNRSTV